MVTGGSHGQRAPKLFGRERPVHEALGRGKAADIILWRRKEVSASILGAATAAWGLFEVAEYHFLTLACYAAMISMLTFFIWTNASAFLNLPVPRIPETVLSERSTRQVILGLHRRLNWFVHKLYDIACGQDLKLFILTVVSLYIGSVIASCFSSLTLLYLVVFCVMTVPALYERYEHEVDHLVARGTHDLRGHLAKMDSGVLRKIPRGKGAAAAHGSTSMQGTVVSLYIGSVIASCFSSLTLLYLVVFCVMTVPALYERYEHEVDHLVARGSHDLRGHLAKMDSGVLRKIPRGKGATAAHGSTNMQGWHQSHIN